VLLIRESEREELNLARGIAAAILTCAVMVLVAAVPLALADTHTITKGGQGPNANAVTWEYVPADYGTWTGHIVNNGLRWIIVDVYDNTTGMLVQVMHQRIRFAAYDAYPAGTVDTAGVIMAMGRPYSITVTPNGPKGSSCTVEDMLKVPTPPVAMFTVATDFMSVAVDGSGSYDLDGTITAYDWTFGDGGVASGVTATHTYAVPGAYTITLTVTDNDGMTGSVSHAVTARPAIPPVASFTATVSHFDVSVDASASSDADGTIVAYSWNWGDGTLTGTGVAATHTYAVAGDYTITLTVTDNDGLTNSASQVVSIVGNAPPVASFTTSINNLIVTVDASASTDLDGTIASYSWNWGDGTPANTTVTASHKYATQGTWWITLTVTDNLGATGSASTQVTVAPGGIPPPPYSVFGYVTDSGGAPVFGASVTVTDAGTGAVWTAVTDDVYGLYLVDLNTNATGWAADDTIVVTVTMGALSGTNSGIAMAPGSESALWLDVVLA
jgi:PKD repeat protein